MAECNPFKRRTRKLETGAKLAARRAVAAATITARRRCSGCGSFLDAQGLCKRTDCEGSRSTPSPR